jgi:hypothetical protein
VYLPWETLALQDILLYYTFVMACSDLRVIHQRKCKEWQKGGFLVA